MRILVCGLVAVAVVVASAQDEQRDPFAFESAGARYGFGTGDLSNDFWQAEAIADFTTPFQLNLGRAWTVKTRLELALGGFGNDHTSAVIGSVGPIFSLAHADFPLALEVGVAPTGLSRDEYETRGIGLEFQIRSEFGLAWTIEKKVRVGYYYQHMSNGGLASDNQGVNMHVFSIAYRF